MRLPPWLKLGLALVLLAAALFSAPMGSMEQRRVDTVQQLTDVSSLPAARLGPGGQLLKVAASPRRLDSSPCIALPAVQPPVGALGPVALPAPGVRGAPRIRPLCERLPHQANAPPAVG
jgi:hypothetical protein